jgi:hypothetical protein
MFRATFTTPFEQYRDRIGQPFTVNRKVTAETMTDVDRAEYDEECLPMYEITFADGYKTAAWPDEVEEAK